MKNRFHSDPLLGLKPHLLFELALRALKPRLALNVELSRRHLEQRRIAHRLARLADEPNDAIAMSDDPDGTRVRNDLAVGLLAILVAEGVDADIDHVPLVRRLRADALHRRVSVSDDERALRGGDHPAMAMQRGRALGDLLGDA